MPSLRLGIIEPHLRRYGGIRRMLEFSNRLIARGHSVTFYLPGDQELFCLWMRCDATVKPIEAGFHDNLDVVLFNHEPHWHLLDRFERARRRVFYALHYGKLYGLLYIPFGLSSAVAPAVYGWVRDTNGDYDPMLYVAMGLYVFGALLLLTLGRYPDLKK